MCIIAVQTVGAKLKDDIIRTMYKGNPDGAGVMWAENGKVQWRKGIFSVEELLKVWHSIPKGVVAAMHCRIKTHGAVSVQLCHPFPLTQGKELYNAHGAASCVMMHNGMMHFMEKNPLYTEIDSDSSAYAKELHKRFGNKLPNANQLDKIRKETEDSNRILILDGKGNFVTSGEWEYKDGILFSNSHWKDWYGNTRLYGNNNYFSAYCRDDYDWDDYSYGVKTKTKTNQLSRKEEWVQDEIAWENGLDRATDIGWVYDDKGNEISMDSSGHLLYSDGLDVYVLIDSVPTLVADLYFTPYDDGYTTYIPSTDEKEEKKK